MPLPPNTKVFDETETPQGSEAWRSLRLGVLTGSRCAPIMVDEGKKPSAGKATLLMELVIERVTRKSPCKEFSTAATEQGLEREPLALARHEFESGQLVRRVGFVYRVGAFIGCSPDGVIGDFDELVSIKCRELKAHAETLRRGVIPADARRQMAHELWVTGARTHHYVSFNPDFPERLQYHCITLDRYDARLELDTYIAKAETFLREVQQEVDFWQQQAFGRPWLRAVDNNTTETTEEVGDGISRV